MVALQKLIFICFILTAFYGVSEPKERQRAAGSGQWAVLDRESLCGCADDSSWDDGII